MDAPTADPGRYQSDERAPEEDADADGARKGERHRDQQHEHADREVGVVQPSHGPQVAVAEQEDEREPGGAGDAGAGEQEGERDGRVRLPERDHHTGPRGAERREREQGEHGVGRVDAAGRHDEPPGLGAPRDGCQRYHGRDGAGDAGEVADDRPRERAGQRGDPDRPGRRSDGGIGLFGDAGTADGLDEHGRAEQAGEERREHAVRGQGRGRREVQRRPAERGADGERTQSGDAPAPGRLRGDEEAHDRPEDDRQVCPDRRIGGRHRLRHRHGEGDGQENGETAPERREPDRLPAPSLDDEPVSGQRRRGHRRVGHAQRERGHHVEERVDDAGREDGRADEPRRAWNRECDRRQQQREVVDVEAGYQTAGRPERDAAEDEAERRRRGRRCEHDLGSERFHRAGMVPSSGLNVRRGRLRDPRRRAAATCVRLSVRRIILGYVWNRTRIVVRARPPRRPRPPDSHQHRASHPAP